MVATETNPGWAAGIAKRTPVKQLAWRLKAAPLRKKDLRLSELSGIAEGRKLRDKVTSLMLEAEANPGDAIVLCVFAEPDLSALAPGAAELEVTSGASDIAHVNSFAGKLPIGFLVFVVDRQDAQKSIFGHARPLIVEDPRGLELNHKALLIVERRVRNKLIASGEIPDDRN
jgi:hypothetical protein